MIINNNTGNNPVEIIIMIETETQSAAQQQSRFQNQT
jgi:hypothetical protein